MSLTPVALSPAAIRQLGRLLAPLPELESLTVGLDPAPYTTFMPRVSRVVSHFEGNLLYALAFTVCFPVLAHVAMYLTVLADLWPDTWWAR